MWRKALIALGLCVVLLAAVGIYSFSRLESQFERRTKEQQKKLQPRVTTGEHLFEKRVFYMGQGLGEVAQVLSGWPADREGAFLTVVGNEGVHFLDESGILKKQIRFSKAVFSPIETARLDASGDYGFLTRDQSWATAVILFDKLGQERWGFSGSILDGVDDSSSGDLQGNGKSEVVVGLNGAGGLVLLDEEGKKIWRQPEGNVWHVEILDTKGDGHKEILHSNARGQLLVRNAMGDVIAHYVPDCYISFFALTRWGEESQASHILVPSGDCHNGHSQQVLLVLDAGGKTLAQFDLPFSDLMGQVRGTRVSFAKGAEFYAVLQSSRVLRRSIFTLYTKDSGVAYREVIEDSCLGIAAAPRETADRLLVGCTNKIWEYFPGEEFEGARDSRQPAFVNK
jgi:hypothetical protein